MLGGRLQPRRVATTACKKPPQAEPRQPPPRGARARVDREPRRSMLASGTPQRATASAHARPEPSAAHPRSISRAAGARMLTARRIDPHTSRHGAVCSTATTPASTAATGDAVSHHPSSDNPGAAAMPPATGCPRRAPERLGVLRGAAGVMSSSPASTGTHAAPMDRGSFGTLGHGGDSPAAPGRTNHPRAALESTRTTPTAP